MKLGMIQIVGKRHADIFRVLSMPVSSFIDYKERIMGGVNSLARKKGSKNTFDDASVSDPNDDD